MGETEERSDDHDDVRHAELVEKGVRSGDAGLYGGVLGDPLKPCCDKEDRVNGGCRSCGDPCF